MIRVPAFAPTDGQLTVHMEANYTSTMLEKQGPGIKPCSGRCKFTYWSKFFTINQKKLGPLCLGIVSTFSLRTVCNFYLFSFYVFLRALL